MKKIPTKTAKVKNQESTEVKDKAPSKSWFKIMRNPALPDLVRANKNVVILIMAIAYRARWNPKSINLHGLEIGEAICDYDNWGLTEREFRTAKSDAEKWGLATFKATNKGTIASLCNSDIFEIVPVANDEQNDGQTTSRATTNLEHRAVEQENIEQPTPLPPNGDLDGLSKLELESLKENGVEVGSSPELEKDHSGENDPVAQQLNSSTADSAGERSEPSYRVDPVKTQYPESVEEALAIKHSRPDMDELPDDALVAFIKPKLANGYFDAHGNPLAHWDLAFIAYAKQWKPKPRKSAPVHYRL
jgi:hypothetical protein